MGGATSSLDSDAGNFYISIHAPRGGSDYTLHTPLNSCILFQSTLPVGGATRIRNGAPNQARFQSTLPVGGATFPDRHIRYYLCDFNPRSPWGERLTSPIANCVPVIFQSTLPVGGATRQRRQENPVRPISIHAPRGGSDQESFC